MTSEETSLSSKEDLSAELKTLLRRAYKSGIDVKGAFECRNGAEHPDWEIIVTEVEKKDRSE